MCVCVYFRTWTNLIEIRLVLNVTGSWNEPRAEIYPFATHGVSRACLAKLRNWPGNIASLISGAPRETCNLLRNSHALHVHLQHVWVVRLQEKVSSCADWEGFMVSILISVVTTLKVWNNPNHRIWPISQCSYLPGEVWGWNAFCFRFQQIQWTDDSVSWYFTPPQFTFFWWGGERMINIQWSRIMTKYELMIGKDLYWLQYIINIDKSWYKSWGGDVNGIYKPWEFSLSVQDGEMRYILHGVGYFVGQEAHWPCHGCLVRLVRG